MPSIGSAATLLAPLVLAAGCVSVTESRSVASNPGCTVGDRMVETQLFLGMATPTGSVSEDQFTRFVESEVTPRWKEGFTILSGQGLWYSEQRQVTEREPSRVLVRFHDGSGEASSAIEAIRSAYIKAFNQDAVLRTDRSTCADF